MGKVKGRDRHTSLLRRGVRIKKGPMELVFLSEKGENPCLAFAIPKTVGKAVVRNKIRRKYREAFRKLLYEKPEIFLQGNYLIKIHSSESENLNTNELLETVLTDLKFKHGND